MQAQSHFLGVRLMSEQLMSKPVWKVGGEGGILQLLLAASAEGITTNHHGIQMMWGVKGRHWSLSSEAGMTAGTSLRGCWDSKRTPTSPLCLLQEGPGPSRPMVPMCSSSLHTAALVEKPALFMGCYHPPGIICVTISSCKVYERSCKISSISSLQLRADYFPA